MNFSDIVDIGAARHPAHEAIRVGDRALDFAELRARSLKVTGLLLDAGVERGDTVGVVLCNALEFAEIAFGIMGAGAVFVPVNTRLAAAEMTYVLDHAEVTLIFHGEEFSPTIEQIRPNLPGVRGTYIVGSSCDAALAEAPAADSFTEMGPDEDCMIVYTSGTTGSPKGVVRSHSSGMWAASNFTTTFGHFPYGDDRFLYTIPLASIGFANIFCGCLFAGMTVELMYSFDSDEALRIIQEHKVTHTYFVPSMWRMILAADHARRDTSSLRVGIWGGERMDAALREAIIARFGGVLVGVFGMTEGAMSSARLGNDETRPRTCGRAAGYNQFRIVDDDGVEVPRGTVGEIINKSPTTLSRYFKDEKATRETLRNGWLHTGDLGSMDEEGYLSVVDRKKEMLISGGQNVYPAEIEQALKQHVAVAAAAVIGVADERWGEAGMAFVVPSGPTPPSAQELAEYTRTLLARYKVPKHWRFVDELPTNANGKVRKVQLREWAKRDA